MSPIRKTCLGCVLLAPGQSAHTVASKMEREREREREMKKLVIVALLGIVFMLSARAATIENDLFVCTVN
jgi:hypothetical protein